MWSIGRRLGNHKWIQQVETFPPGKTDFEREYGPAIWT